MHLLAQVSRNVEPWSAVHDQFNKGAYWKGIVLVMAAILAFLLLLHFILYYQKRVEHPKQERDEHKLFSEVLRSLPLRVMQRNLLTRMARDLKMSSPLDMLLSPRLFTVASRRWLSATTTNTAKRAAELKEIAAALFPEVAAIRESAAGPAAMNVI